MRMKQGCLQNEVIAISANGDLTITPNTMESNIHLAHAQLMLYFIAIRIGRF